MTLPARLIAQPTAPTTKAEALAAWLDMEACGGTDWNKTMHAAAAELRRLHQRCEELSKANADWSSLFRRLRNIAAGYSNYCEESGSTRRLEREFDAVEADARALRAQEQDR